MNRPLLSLKNRTAAKPSESVSQAVSDNSVVSSVVVQRKRRYVVTAPPKAVLEAPEMAGPVVCATITRKPKPIVKTETEPKPVKPAKKPKVQPPPKPLPLPEIPRFVRVAVTLTALRETWPHLFDEADPKPWAVHIRKDMWKALKKKHSRCLIGDALQLWKNLHPAYMEKLKIAGTPRFDLDGNPKGVVTEEQANMMQDNTESP